MHFFRAGCPHHLDDLSACGAANNRVIDKDDAFSLKQFFYRMQFYLHTEIADPRFGFDEGAADVMIADQSEGKWNARFL